MPFRTLIATCTSSDSTVTVVWLSQCTRSQVSVLISFSFSEFVRTTIFSLSPDTCDLTETGKSTPRIPRTRPGRRFKETPF